MSDDLRNAVLKSGQSRFYNQVHWARQYLVWEGLVESGQRGVWSLTPKGRNAKLTATEAQQLALPPKEIRGLRRAMDGRAEKGILLTTSTVSIHARAEAERPGAAPIELVDGLKLFDMFKKYELGLRPRIVYDVDHSSM